MSAITHFICPQVIDIDQVDSKVEAIVDFVPIAVHAAYVCEQTIQLQLVNTTPEEDSPTYKIQTYSGADLDTSALTTLLEVPLSNMRHLSVNGTTVDDGDVSGASLTTINEDLSSLLYPTAAEDTGSGNFTLKKEVFKTLSSYLTNHATLSLTSSITDLSGAAHEQLNAASSIAAELIRFGSLVQDASGDDTLGFLNTMLDNNNGNEVFGSNSLKTIVFIVKSSVTATSDSSSATGLQSQNLSAVQSISNRSSFADELGGDNSSAQNYLGQDAASVEIDGDWYAALVFPLD
tara:strand:- start:2605 stop:3477 length:873 start_codon:yes stop_codon:yes gene_type:complete